MRWRVTVIVMSYIAYFVKYNVSSHTHTPTQTHTCFRISPCKPIHHCSSCSQFIFAHIHYSGAAGHQFIHTEMPENLRSICSTGWFFVFRLFTPPRVRRATDEIWLFRFRMPLIGYGEWIMSSGGGGVIWFDETKSWFMNGWHGWMGSACVFAVPIGGNSLFPIFSGGGKRATYMTITAAIFIWILAGMFSVPALYGSHIKVSPFNVTWFGTSSPSAWHWFALTSTSTSAPRHQQQHLVQLLLSVSGGLARVRQISGDGSFSAVLRDSSVHHRLLLRADCAPLGERPRAGRDAGNHATGEAGRAWRSICIYIMYGWVRLMVMDVRQYLCHQCVCKHNHFRN